MTEKKNSATVRIYINGKEMLYSHQNIVAAINSFLPYLTNDDLSFDDNSHSHIQSSAQHFIK